MADERYYVCVNAHVVEVPKVFHAPLKCDICTSDLMWGPMPYTEAHWCKRARINHLKANKYYQLSKELRNSLGIIINAVNEMRDAMHQAGYTWPISGLSDAEIVLEKAHQQLRLW